MPTSKSWTTASVAPSGLDAWSGELVTLVAIVSAIALAPGLFLRTQILLTLGTFVGLLCALGCRRWWSALVVAPLGIVGGVFLATLASRNIWPHTLFWLPTALEASAVAAAIGALLILGGAKIARLRPLLIAVALAVLVGSLFMAGFSVAGTPARDGSTAVTHLIARPVFRQTSLDEDIYLAYVQRLHDGQPYYPMAVKVLAEVNAGRPNAPLTIGSPLSYRLPTLYWLLARLPNDGVSLIVAMLLGGSVATIAAFALARRYVSDVPALAGAAVVAGVFTGYAGLPLLGTESWAGVLGLVAVAFAIHSFAEKRRSLGLQLAAVCFALAAAAIRELAAPFLVLGLVAALVDTGARRRRWWVAWALALAAIAVAYPAHWLAARAAYAGVPSIRMSTTWFSPNGVGLRAAVDLLAAHVWSTPGIAWLLAGLGMLGAAIAPRDRASRVWLWGVVLGGPIALLFVHPPGFSTYGVPGYWGDIVMPTVVACCALTFARMRAVAATEAPQAADAEPAADSADHAD